MSIRNALFDFDKQDSCTVQLKFYSKGNAVMEYRTTFMTRAVAKLERTRAMYTMYKAKTVVRLCLL